MKIFMPILLDAVILSNINGNTLKRKILEELHKKKRK